MIPKQRTGTQLPDRTTLTAFVALVLFTGGASVAIRFTYAELPHFWSAAARFICASLFFWAWVLVSRIELPKGKALLGAMLFGVFGMGLSFSLIYWGLVKTPASLYQTILALVPLLTLFFAFFHRLEPFRSRGLLGAFLTVVGIALAVGGSKGANLSFPRILAIIGGAACLAEAGVVAKLFPSSHPVATNAVAMTVGAAILSMASFLAGETPVIPTAIKTWIAFAYIVVFVTIITFSLYLFVLSRWTATSTSYHFVLIPLVTIILANWLADEQVSWQFLLGGTLVILGVWVGALLTPKAKPDTN
jgi:drug/metabolite transporter (DMT)-like permease